MVHRFRRIRSAIIYGASGFFFRLKCFFLFTPVIVTLGLPPPAEAASLPAGFVEQSIGGAWNEAIGLLFDDNGRMYVWERAGRVWIVENGVKLSTPLIDISDEVGGWRDFGLLGFTLDPNFAQNGFIYLLYVVDHHHLVNFGTPNYNPNANEYNQATIGRITRYTANAANAFRSVDMSSRRVLLGERIDNGFPILFESHGVGSMVFGTDGTLLASCGDGASYASTDVGSASETYYSAALSQGIIKQKENVGAYRAQLVDSLSGKVVRIDSVTGDGIPSNPFYDSANPRAARSRVWALGLRNPCRMTLRAGTGSHNRADANPGALYIGDVGWDTWEELNIAAGPGKNFGWPVFEGMQTHSLYYNASPANRDAPNPLFNTGGCTQQYFSFRDLIKQDSLNAPSFPNPCNSAAQIPGTIFRFVHTRAAIDWGHWSGARVGTFDGSGNATVADVGAPGSPVSGTQFSGSCSIGGVWYTNTDFPAQYRNTYYQADYVQGWIRTFNFDQNNNPVSTANFMTNGGGIVAISADTRNGGLYYLSWTSDLRKISYGGNKPPLAVASANKSFGPSPLVVQFTGSSSTDPEGGALTYNWNFGDGTANSTLANPQHTFNAAAGVPTKYTVTLTVRDNASATGVATLIVSANNTPPSVTITNPVPGTRYSLSQNTVYNLRASVSDAESAEAQIAYQWQTILHHNSHEHPEPLDTNHLTTTVISPIGCDGNLYYYRIILTVTDPAGLSATNEVDLFPACSNQTPIAAFTATPTNGSPPLLVSFDALSSRDPDGDPLTFSWAFGDSTSGSGPTPTHTYSAAGTYTAALTATDTFGLSGTATVRISVASANTAPTISSIANRTITEDTSTGPIAFTIGDAQTAAGNLTLSAASTNTALIPVSSITFGGSASNRTVGILPATNQTGSAMITITVSDGSATSSSSFLLTVTGINDPPTISTLPPQTIGRSTSTGPLNFTVSDPETPVGSLSLNGTSSNTALVPHTNIVFSGSGGNRIVTVTPITNRTGNSTITLTVSDGAATASSSFLLTVTAVNATPTISPIANQTILRNTRTAPLSFTVGDPDTPADSLTVGATSSNSALITNFVFGGSGSNRTVTVTPITNRFGNSTITLNVTDGASSTSTTFQVSVIVPPAPFALKVNFQSNSVPPLAGYLADQGLVYGDRGAGNFYGWDAVNTAWARERNLPLSPDKRFDTLNHMQQAGSRIWEVGLSNGTYTVLLVAGDPGFTNSVYKINVEGLLTVDGMPTDNQPWFFGTRTVTVADGRLTVSSAPGATNNKICFVEIVGAPVASGTDAPPRLTFLRRDGNGWAYLALDGQAGRNYVVEASSNLTYWYPLTLLQQLDMSVTYIDKNAASASQCFYRTSLAR